MHFFDISTAKSGPELVCFVHFDLEMCFAPQRRALFDIATSKSVVTVDTSFTSFVVHRGHSSGTKKDNQKASVGRLQCKIQKPSRLFDIDLLAVFARSVSRFSPRIRQL